MGDERAEWREERDVDLSYRPVLSLGIASGRAAEAVWVGSARGLLRVRAAGGGIDISVMPSVAVGSVVEADGRVWIGTVHGLYSMLVPDSIGQSVQPNRVEGPSALRSPVGALAASGDTVYAGLDREVWWRAGREAEWNRLEPAGRARAAVSALAIRGGVLWVGSAAELTVAEVAGGVVGRYSFGPDLPPGPRGETAIADISVVSETEAWVATPAGAVRLHVRH
jgi:ligand-binding sensor domain-containing protein